ncbi:hypothetical protein HYV74_00705 [Candidatus Uhrbacteria bacterium]|nr:hypothetical protein [Candidatus Uhrbacteria bacterium]
MPKYPSSTGAVLCVLVATGMVIGEWPAEARPTMSLLERMRTARSAVATATVQPKWCTARVRVGKRWRMRGSNCSIAAAAVGIPQQGTWMIVAFPWGMDTFHVDRFRFVRLGQRKGINTEYLVLRRTTNDTYVSMGDAVLAWKVPVRQQNGTWINVVYTPYASALHRPAMVAEGRRLLGSVIHDARSQLDRRKVYSVAGDGRWVTSVVPAATTETIAIVEKMDHYEFSLCQQRARAEERARCLRRLMEVPYVVLAANGPDAYRYALSRSRARGFMQFMPGTWAMVQRAYPEARLPPFMEGASDQTTAAMAAILLNDYNTQYLQDAHRRTLGPTPESFTLYAAAAYNGNPKWAIQAIGRCGAHWMDRRRCGILRSETAVYMEKVRVVWPKISTI